MFGSICSSRVRTDDQEPIGDQFARVVAPRQLEDPNNRRKWKLPEAEDERGPYICELNIAHVGGLPGAANAFIQIYHDLMQEFGKKGRGGKTRVGADEYPDAVPIAKTYYRCMLSVIEWRALIARDQRRAKEQARSRQSGRATSEPPSHLSPLAGLSGHRPDRSIATIKADAAQRAFDAGGDGITWAVIDSGVQADHAHFGSSGPDHVLSAEGVANLHRCFCPLFEVRNGVRIEKGPLADPDSDPNMDPEDRRQLLESHRNHACSDEFGHGTHVAGIIAGQAPHRSNIPVRAFAREDNVDEEGKRIARTYVSRPVPDPGRLRGVAPRCRLISLRVLDDQGNGRASDVMRALNYIREKLNDNPKLMRVHGVNLSVGYEFDAEMFACGQSPLCTEVDRLVQSGVVVVAAAGNTGYGVVAAAARATKVGLSNTINGPGNAALAITVGSTHRDSPHTFGVSFFSSKGPTGG